MSIEYRRALIIKLRHHGDVLLSTPVISALKARYDGICVDALIYRECADMLQFHPQLRDTHWIDRNWKKEGSWHQVREEWRLWKRLRQADYDLVINLSHGWRAAILCRYLSPRTSVSEDYNRYRQRPAWRRSFTYTCASTPSDVLHAVDRNLRTLGLVDWFPANRFRPCLGLSQQALARQRAIVAENDLESSGYWVLHPGARWPFKCWEVKQWQQVLQSLDASSMPPLLITGAPNPREQEEAAMIAGSYPGRVIDLSGQVDLNLLGALIAEARLFVGVDSVPMHIAASFGVPLVALFGPSKLNEWSPYSENASLLYAGDYGVLPHPDAVDTGTRERYLSSIPVSRVCEEIELRLKAAQGRSA